jgi:hypothetical protein
MHFQDENVTYYDEFESYYMLFVHASSLLDPEVDARSNAEQLTVPWESWGPLKARMMRDMYDDRPDCHVYGMRYVWQEAVEDAKWHQNRLRMLDFNPLALRRGESQPVNF